jgi:hypothetical protein
VYTDATEALGTSRVMSLERAVLSCCRVGTPRVETLVAVLTEMFVALDTDVHRHSTARPLTGPPLDRLRLRVEAGLRSWRTPGTEAYGAARLVVKTLPPHIPDFQAPCHRLEKLLQRLEALPELRVGHAHGDLNGRNVLVGLARGQATSPKVFDYEHMAADNLVAWDFVKLETELKVRALARVRAGKDDELALRAYRFEELLDRALWARRTSAALQDGLEPAERRLFRLVLTVRKLAAQHLRRKRARDWREEYSFLLACYGLAAGQYPSHSRRQLIAAYSAAAFAARAYADLRCQSHDLVREARTAALDQFANGLPEAWWLHYRPPLAFARRRLRLRDRPSVEAAVQLLERLADEFPHVGEVQRGLALALWRLFNLSGDSAHLDRAWRMVERLTAQGRDRDAEGLLWELLREARLHPREELALPPWPVPDLEAGARRRTGTGRIDLDSLRQEFGTP